jgi:hypothetical protein
VDVLPVSTRPGHADGLRQFRTEVLEALAADHVRRANGALQARLRRLIAVTAAALDGGEAGEKPASGTIELEKRRGAAAEQVGRQTDRLAGSAATVLESAAAAVAAAWARREDGASAARSAIQAAAGRALASVRDALDSARTGGAEAGPATRRVPPLFDPEFLDAIKEMPSPRYLPGFLRSGAARRAVAPLLPHLDQALARFAARLRAWSEGALKELRPPEEAGAAGVVRHAELRALDDMVARVGQSEEEVHAHSFP